MFAPKLVCRCIKAWSFNYICGFSLIGTNILTKLLDCWFTRIVAEDLPEENADNAAGFAK